MELESILTEDLTKWQDVDNEEVSGAVEEEQLLMEMNCFLSERYDDIQERAVPVKPRHD